MPSAVPLVHVVRSGLEESVHTGHVAVCDAEGRLVASVGDPDRLVFSRSSMKPIQAAVSLRAIVDAPPEALVAVMCASHNGEPAHVRAVRALLRLGEPSERDLRCPPDLPRRRRDARTAGRPRRIFHNCSGKHAGMLVACERAGYDLATYLEPSHPLQRAIVRAVVRATGVRRPLIGVDGCGAPVHGLPLAGMATIFARLASPERLGVLAGSVSRAVTAMRSHPYLVAGEGRSDTVLMREVPALVTKVGAEGLHCAALIEAGLGVAVRVADGADRAAAPALVRVLEELGVVGPGIYERLGRVARPPVLGGGRPVGSLEAVFRLRGAT